MTENQYNARNKMATFYKLVQTKKDSRNALEEEKGGRRGKKNIPDGSIELFRITGLA